MKIGLCRKLILAIAMTALRANKDIDQEESPTKDCLPRCPESKFYQDLIPTQQYFLETIWMPGFNETCPIRNMQKDQCTSFLDFVKTCYESLFRDGKHEKEIKTSIEYYKFDTPSCGTLVIPEPDAECQLQFYRNRKPTNWEKYFDLDYDCNTNSELIRLIPYGDEPGVYDYCYFSSSVPFFWVFILLYIITVCYLTVKIMTFCLDRALKAGYDRSFIVIWLGKKDRPKSDISEEKKNIADLETGDIEEKKYIIDLV